MATVAQLSNHGYLLTDIFSKETLDLLCNLVDSFAPTQVQGAEGQHRDAYFLFKDKTISDLVNTELIPIINQVSSIARSPGLELWRDYPGYRNPLHLDDPVVENVLIAYLGKDVADVGTEYYENDQYYYAPYEFNTGLILLKSTEITHGMKGTVPDGMVRKVFYSNWRI